MRSEAATRGAARLFFIDHLRGALAALVVVHHVALVYGGAAPFYYVEPPKNDPQAFLVLLVFGLVNQAWFMGAFFFLAGYFTPGSFERKGPGRFLKDRLLRFGIPLALFIFVLNPIASLGVYQMPTHLTGITTPLTWRAYPHLLAMGPMWFVALLIIFTLGYAGWQTTAGKGQSNPARESQLPGYLAIGLFILALATASFLVRIVIPLGKEVLGFPTLAYLPQYLGFFVAGIIASRRNWLESLPNSMGVAGLIAAGLAGVLLFPIAFSGRPFSLALSPALAEALGHGTLPSAVYALWDSLFAVGICLGLITLFRSYCQEPGWFGRFLSQQSYAVYVFHIPILVFLALAMRGIALGSLPKFGVAALIAVPTSFGVAYLVRRLPFAGRVL